MEITGEEKLLEPIKFYKTELAEKFLEKITNIFDKLLKESNIDINANRKSVKEYNKLTTERDKSQRKLKWVKRFSVASIIGLIYLAYREYYFVDYLKYLMDVNEDYKEVALTTTYYGLGILALLIFNFKYLRDKKKSLGSTIEELEAKANEKKMECYSQVNPLLSLFDSGMANKVITEVIPTLNIDEHFKIERYADLVNTFGMSEQLPGNFSTKDIISGEILGNPFIITKSICNTVVDEVYTGSRTVTWTEYYTDSNGKRASRTRSETLTASIVRPKQVFDDIVNLIYANNASEHLTFERDPGYIHRLTPKKLAKHIKKKVKELQKKSDRAIRKGESFQEMGNMEFDALFNALNRDHEVEFRVLFTPIAQRNMLELLKDEDFGDEFTFVKARKINNIFNGRNWILNVDKDYYRDFSFDTIKEVFFDVNKEYFNNFYRLFLPILSIPVYHQHKSQDYIYSDEYRCNYNPYTAEVMANLVGQNIFSHVDSVTPAILKTRTINSSGNKDVVEVTSTSYKTIIRTVYVPKRASNGRTYQVPVDWPEYIPLSAISQMGMTNTDHDEKEFENSLNSEKYEFIHGTDFAYRNKIIAFRNK